MEFTRKAPRMTVFRPERSPKRKVSSPKHSVVEYWNSFVNLRTHKKNSKVYSQSGIMADRLQAGLNIPLWNDDWLSRYNIHSSMLKKEYSRKKISTGIKNLNTMASLGYWPGDHSWLSSMSLSDAIYNPRTQVSWIIFAMNNNPIVMKDYVENDVLEEIIPFVEIFQSKKIPISPASVNKIMKQYKIDYHRLSDSVKYIMGGVGMFCTMYAEWLCHKREFRPGTNYTPDGYLYQDFIKGLL